MKKKQSQKGTYDIEDERDIIKILYQLYVIGSFMAIKEYKCLLLRLLKNFRQ